MHKSKRVSANYVRKFIPSLRRVTTVEGRRWAVNGKQFFVTLQDVIEWAQKPSVVKDENLAEVLNEGAVKEVDDVATN